MNGLVTVDIVSRVWAAEQKELAAIGKRHGERLRVFDLRPVAGRVGL